MPDDARPRQATRTAPFTLVGLDHIVYLVDDMAKALDFYRGVLGCVDGYSYPNIGMEQVWCGSALIVLWDITHPGAAHGIPEVKGGRNVDHLCIALSPFDDDEMRQYLADNNVTVLREAHHGGARGMGTSFYILDPFGNQLELKGPAVYPDGRVAKDE